MIKKQLLISFASSLLFSMVFPSFTQAEELKKPSIKAKSAIVLNADTGEILFEKNPDTSLPTASLAKVMTLTIAADYLKKGKEKKDEPISISEKAWKTGGSRMFLEAGSQYSFLGVFKGIAVVSGNDASVAMAEHLAGSEEQFVKKMNQKADELNMKNTVFHSSNGLPKGNKTDQSTARDLAILTSYYLKKNQNLLHIHQLKEYTTKTRTHDITQPNRNPIIQDYKGGTGLKTGWISGHYNLIATASREHLNLVAVVLKPPSDQDRKQDAFSLLDYGFSQYITLKFGEKDEPIDTIKTYRTKDLKKTHIYLESDAHITTLVTHKEAVTVTDKLPQYLTGGVKSGDKIGKRIIQTPDKTYEFNIIVKEDLPKVPFFSLQNLWDSVSMIFEYVVQTVFN